MDDLIPVKHPMQKDRIRVRGTPYDDITPASYSDSRYVLTAGGEEIPPAKNLDDIKEEDEGEDESKQKAIKSLSIEHQGSGVP